MINLYNSTENSFNHNGLVVLSDCKTAFVEEALNGKYELELEYPIDDRGKWGYLTDGNIIKTGGQLFRIYNKVKTLGGIKVNARHIFYDLLNNFIESCAVGNLNAAGALDAILSSTQYSHGYTSMSDIDAVDTYEIDKNNPVQAIMGADGVISRYSGELVRDNFTIRLYQSRGMDRGVLISYGKNVIGIEETLNTDSVITRILPIGKDGLVLPEKYLDSELIDNYPHPIVRPMEFSDCEAEETLRAAGQSYLDANDKPLVNYKINFVELTKTIEYKNYAILETVYMGDTVTIRHTKLNINIQAKVIRIKKNELTKRIEEIELGSFKPNLANSITKPINDIKQQQIQDKTDLQKAIDDATSLINNALGGYVIKRNGELLIMDTEDILTATKVWRWNQDGLGYSGTGYNGPYRLAMTSNGQIVADFITTGTLNASLIKVGTLTSKTGKLSIGLDDEVLSIGGKIVYNGATEELTFAEDVVLSWDNIGDKPNLTRIDGEGIYTGTLTAEQVSAVLVEGVNITALDELAIRGHADTGLGINPRLVWQCADSLGESYIKDTPNNPGTTSESDTLFWGVNSKDPDGSNETNRGRVFLYGDQDGAELYENLGWVDLVVMGTIQTGTGGSYADARWSVDMNGLMRFKPPSGNGRVCEINPYEGYLRMSAGDNYIRVNPLETGGSILDLVTLINGVSTTVFSVGASGDAVANGVALGGVGAIPTNTSLYISENSINILRDGVGDQWAVSRDNSGNLTSMSNGGRTISLTSTA